MSSDVTPNYWKIRALALLAMNAQDEAAVALKRLDDAMNAQGLKLGTAYVYDDETQTISERKG